MVVSAAITTSHEVAELASTKDDTVMTIHKILLGFYSSYYAAAFNGRFSEASKKRFNVDLSGEALKTCASWIFTGGLYGSTDDFDVSLYIFADKADILALRRVILDRIAE